MKAMLLALANASLFAQPWSRLVLGVETLYQGRGDDSTELGVVPQIGIGVTDEFSLQAGVGLDLPDTPVETEALLRVIFRL